MTIAQKVTVAVLAVIAALMVAAVLLSMAVAGQFDYTNGRITTRVGGVWR